MRIVTSTKNKSSSPMVTRPQSSPDVFLFQSSVFLIQVEAPEGVAEDLVLNALGFVGVAFDGHAGTRRGQDVEAVRRRRSGECEKDG